MAMIITFFGLSFGAMRGDSAIVDELAHVPAAYSYIKYGDMRLNPEHPPLLKDLAGIPLQFMDLVFPDNVPAWREEVNAQYYVGYEFIYRSGNDAHAIIFWSRLPILVFCTFMLGVFYWLVRKRFGIPVGLVALGFLVFSPNLIAHSHYLTTDGGSTLAIFVALVAFVRYLERPNRSSLIILSLGLALAQVCKFSSILLYPFMFLVCFGLLGLQSRTQVWKYSKGVFWASCLSLVWIFMVYIPNTINTPELALRNIIAAYLAGGIGTVITAIILPLLEIPLFKALATYIMGLGMVVLRVGGGNVTYFNGSVTNQSFHLYFPQIFLLKTQIPFLILLIGLPVIGILRHARERRQTLASYMQNHRYEWIMGAFAVFYFVVAILGNLNLGIRHILPIYPPLAVIVALGMMRLYRSAGIRRRLVGGTFAVLCLWYVVSTVAIYPHFTAYFNGLLGGPSKAAQYFSDSGLDWGQDLDRLKSYIDAHPEIDKFGLDYFGGGVPAYTFCRRIYATDGRMVPGDQGYDCSDTKYVQWFGVYDKYPGQYLAVSVTSLNSDLYNAKTEGRTGYGYLRGLEPIAKIGYSIYLYKLY